MSNAKKEFNTTLTALWETKGGNALSMAVDARTFDQIQKAMEKVEIGGKFIVKRLKEEAKQKFKNPDTAPTYFLEYISKKDVEEFAKSKEKGNSRSGL